MFFLAFKRKLKTHLLKLFIFLPRFHSLLDLFDLSLCLVSHICLYGCFYVSDSCDWRYNIFGLSILFLRTRYLSNTTRQSFLIILNDMNLCLSCSTEVFPACLSHLSSTQRACFLASGKNKILSWNVVFQNLLLFFKLCLMEPNSPASFTSCWGYS